MFYLQDNDNLNIKSNTKIMYLRGNNFCQELSYIRRIQNYWSEDSFCFAMPMIPVEHILTLDVESGKVSFSVCAKEMCDNDAEHNCKYEYKHKHYDIDSEYVYIPFVEAQSDYRITIYNNQINSDSS